MTRRASPRNHKVQGQSGGVGLLARDSGVLAQNNEPTKRSTTRCNSDFYRFRCCSLLSEVDQENDIYAKI